MTMIKKVFIATLLLLLLGTGGYILWNSQKNAQTQENTADVEGKSDFELGQYYFNHDSDPGGPYDLALARTHFQKAVADDPRVDPLAWYQLGRVEFIEGNFDAALADFDKQIEYFGDGIPNVYYMIGLTYGYKARQSGEESDWQGAEEAFSTFITYAPQAPWGRVDLAWVYFAQGKFEAMLPVLEEGITFRPENPWLRNMYGLALLNTGNKQQAHEEFLRARDLASVLTPEEWGKAYPGNNPEIWGQGLDEFRGIIEKNITLASE